MTVLLILGPEPGLRQVTPLTETELERLTDTYDSELRSPHSLRAQHMLRAGEHVRLPDGRIVVDLLAHYDAVLRGEKP